MAVKLKPCPLCGNENVQVVRHSVGSKPRGVWNVGCGDDVSDYGCGLVLFGGKQKMWEMVKLWNTRAVPPSLVNHDCGHVDEDARQSWTQ